MAFPLRRFGHWLLESSAFLGQSRSTFAPSRCIDLRGTRPEDRDVEILCPGRALQSVISKENSTIIDGAGEADGIQARIKQINAQIEETTSDYDREKLQERVAKLTGGVAVIKVVAATEVEVKVRRPALKTPCTPPVQLWKKVWSPAAAWR